MTSKPPQGESNVSTPIKRIRWATQRVTGANARRKRHTIIDRFHRRASAHGKKRESAATSLEEGSTKARHDSDSSETESQIADSQRTIFFNLPLPDRLKDEDGRPLTSFERNKVRTAKYTPLSFIPKNLWFQFQNVANIYFLFIIILSFFSIFGASNPGLNSVPLIFILTVTGIKDAVEDYRRTALDNELNNSPVYRLVDWNNVNSTEDRVSLWRRLKKATSHTLRRVAGWWKGRKSRKQARKPADTDGAVDKRRPSIGTRASVYSTYSQRASVYSDKDASRSESIPMAEVKTPAARRLGPADSTLSAPDRPVTAFSYEEDPSGMDGVSPSPVQDGSGSPENVPPMARVYGSVIDPTKPAPGKARFKRDHWKSVQVGDFVRIYNNDQIPADVVILSTSDPDGACYVETKNLDGETNLKVRQALHCGRKVKHARDCERASFFIESELPHANLYQYSGAVRWKQHDAKNPQSPPKDMAEPISIQNLLLRGCSLRNTEWVLGIVVFTGKETKIMINSGITPSKRSRISRELNWNVIYNFIILFLMCLISGIVQGAAWGRENTSIKFFEFGAIASSPALNGFVTFWSAVILFQNLVPISLYITLEIIKTLQVFFIYSDVNMYYDKIDYPCTPKSWNISDDLGQIEYIFSDKTGTLTQNVMEFKKCTINGVPYGEAYTEAQIGLQRRQGVNVDEEGPRMHARIATDRKKMLGMIRDIHDNPYLHDNELTFVSPDYISDLRGEAGEAQSAANRHFMLALALCHTVISERTPGDPPKIEFKAQSPDEAALVSTARDCGFTFLGRSHDSLIVNIMGEEKQYQILNTLEFNSTRKRMSAIVRMPEDNRIVLFCKGADSVIYSRLKPGEQAELRQATAEHLETFAREGLRTLCIAQRELDEEEYQRWNKEHDLAAAAVQDREDKLERVADAIERELTLLGGTAIEDRLQDGVPDTIALLADAGIKLWVLTGDKVETAINIGFACNLLTNDMELLIYKVEDDSMETARAELAKLLALFNITGSDEELAAARKNHEAPPPTHALVIDGDSLRLVLTGELRQKFLLLCKQCKSILCCRVSPSQKAAVVEMVKNGLDVMTLSVGDGANDVAMIQEADVGVGIAGEEGRQAVMSSDYAIGQFRYLQRLVLVHGRWSYRRLAETIANFFYKNIVWTFTLFWYQIYTNFDCTYLYEYTYILLINIAFTSLPVILMGVLDQDVSDKVSLAVPQLYRRGIERKEWTQIKFWVYMIDGVYQSLMCFYITYLAFAPADFVTKAGHLVNDPPQMGVYVGCVAVFIVNVYILLNTYRWDWLMLLITFVSVMLIWFWTGVYSSFKASNDFYKAGSHVYSQLSYWAIFLLTVAICLTPRFASKAFQKLFMPRDIDIVREQVRQGKFKYLDADKAAAPGQRRPGASPAASSSSSAALPPGGSPPAGSSHAPHLSEDRTPLYPPSVAATTITTQDPAGGMGGDLNEYPVTRDSLERPPFVAMHRPRPSYDRIRSSMDRIRPSFEASNDLTTAAMLTRIESSHYHGRTPRQSDDIRRSMS